MRTRQQIARELMAIEVNALRVAEIAILRRERDFWRQRCLRLETVVARRARKSAGRSGWR